MTITAHPASTEAPGKLQMATSSSSVGGEIEQAHYPTMGALGERAIVRGVDVVNTAACEYKWLVGERIVQSPYKTDRRESSGTVPVWDRYHRGRLAMKVCGMVGGRLTYKH